MRTVLTVSSDLPNARPGTRPVVGARARLPQRAGWGPAGPSRPHFKRQQEEEPMLKSPRNAFSILRSTAAPSRVTAVIRTLGRAVAGWRRRRRSGRGIDHLSEYLRRDIGLGP